MRIESTVAALALGAASLVAAVVPGTPALAAPAATCPDNGWSIRDGGTGYLFAASGVNIRTGPSTDCTSVGLGYPNHLVRLDCQKAGWSHIFDHTTGKLGWVRNDMLSNLPLRNC
ncbi:SH3 domain-containing protein [Plantactinospora sp. ZYX-F-223]|uniref:SH3 domain-containing protein n=1 Tax=Plantactinospora sp. ZYX-F-223 TaxID=3144103 RepID=UPI0031FE3326